MLLLKVIKKILNHPLNRRSKTSTLVRFIKWQIASRILPYPVVFPFMERSKLIITRGMTGATGNLYCGLDEFTDMGFLLHFLQEGDLFGDVGANIGSYTVLAASEIGCQTISIEPHPKTFSKLSDNIRINDISNRIIALNIGMGSKPGKVDFSDGLDTTNHVVLAPENSKTVSVNIKKLDDIMEGKSPALLKVDVEGFEKEVFAGAEKTLAKPELQAIIVELVGHGARYGFNDADVHEQLIDHGFQPYIYEPFQKKLTHVSEFSTQNTIYIRDLQAVKTRISQAKKYSVNGQTF